jgi:5-methylcytosine-specific restriction protein A
MNEKITKLENLRPAIKENVKDVVEAIGIPWEGCNQYAWSFGQVGGPNLITQEFDGSLDFDGDHVFDGLQEENETIFFIDRFKDWSNFLAATGKPTQVMNSSYEVHERIMKSFFQKTSLRVAIINSHTSVNGQEHVDKRELDSELWYAHHIDPKSGNYVVVRGVPQPSDYVPADAFKNFQTGADTGPLVPPHETPEIPSKSSLEQPPEEPADQSPQTRTNLTTTYTRDSAVAQEAKQRAFNGACEFCYKQGFETAKGGYYLEAHHVIPRNCEGPDELWNIVAICADDHKRSHFGIDRQAFRDQLIAILGGHYPDRLETLRTAAKKMDENEKSSEQLEKNTET